MNILMKVVRFFLVFFGLTCIILGAYTLIITGSREMTILLSMQCLQTIGIGIICISEGWEY